MARTTLARGLQYLATLVALFGALYLFLVAIQPYRFSTVLAEKRGRVVDAQTGAGLANVAVIVNYVLWSSTPMQAGYSGCIHQKIAWTDADGNYVIPNASNDVDVAQDMFWRMLPGFSRNYGWMLDYYKEGYVEQRHLEGVLDRIERRPQPRAGRPVPYAKYGPSYAGSLTQSWIDPPVQMQKIDMASSPIIADAYIASAKGVMRFLRCSLYDEENTAASLELRREIKSSVKKVICGLPVDKVLADETRGADFYSCSERIGIKKIGDKRFRDGALTAGDICKAFDYVPSEDECRMSGDRKVPPLQIVPQLRHLPLSE